MQNYIVNNILNYLDNKTYSITQKQEIKYGLEALYLTITKAIFIFGLALIFDKFLSTLLLVLLYSIIRQYSYGLHASRTINCLFASAFLFLLPTFVINSFKVAIDQHIFIAIFSLTLFSFYAPADTMKRPLINVSHRLKLKIKSLHIVVIYLILSFSINNSIVVNSLLYILILQSILISPALYWLLRQRYQNYKYYKKEENE